MLFDDLLKVLLLVFVISVSATTGPFLRRVTDAIVEGTVDEVDDAVETAGGYSVLYKKKPELLYYAASNQKLVIFKHLITKGFSVDAIVPGLNIPIYRFIITMKSTPIRDRMLRIAYETSDNMLEDYYKPKFKKSGWDVDAAEAMKQNDFIFIDRILNRHKAHPDNVVTNQGLMIHSAVLNDCPECVKLILKAGGNPNHPYVGGAQLNDCVVGDEANVISSWTPLMMAIAKGNIRVIEAILESTELQVCKGLPGNQMFTARHLVRQLGDKKLKFELLKKLHARPGDQSALEKWIQGIALEHLTMKFALQKKKRNLVEFILHNCTTEIDKEWIKYAVTNSNAECLKILISEYPNSIMALDLESLISENDCEAEQKRIAIDST